MRVGFGYDIHPFVAGRPLILGGIEIPSAYGLEGHSDADVLIHALCDALLGAIAAGDIGKHFPNTDPQYKDIQSTILLQRVNALLREAGFYVANADATIVAEQPKLAPFIPRMVERLSEVLEVDRGRINVKATTSEGLGPIGRREGIAAYAVALVGETR
jgi:2-C-methyl-D-erythritol 2,4-cyclodiphosphate synthase